MLGSERKTPIAIFIGLALWLSIVSGATILLNRYSNTPGDEQPAPASWPKDCSIPFDSARPTLLMFVHPHCPCTRASLGELERLLAEVPTPPNVQVVWVKPAGTPSDWHRTDLWRDVSSIRDLRVYTDDGGIEAQRFHAETSGQTLLYSPDGGLKFQGGITLARGHAGDNPGLAAVRELLQQGHSNRKNNPVFGCGLLDAQCQTGGVVCKP